MTYKAIVIGMGKRGKHHATAFQENENFDVAGVCDVDESRLAEAKELLGRDDVAASTDAAELAASVKPDVLCFCTMPHLREDFIRIAIENGCKMVAFEKPLADSSAAAMRIRRRIEESGLKAVVSHQHRYGEHYAKVKSVVASGAIGKVHTVYASTPGWMMHMMSHMLDYMRWYNDEAEAEWVMAQGAGRIKLSDNHPSPDYVAGVVQFANGVRGVVETGAGAPNVEGVAKWWGRNRIRVMGDEGFAEVITNGGWRAVTAEGMQSGEGAMNYEHDMKRYVQDMADWLRDDAARHPCHFGSAYKGFEIIMALCRSIVKGGQIALPLDGPDDEIQELRDAMSDRPVILAHPDHAEEFSAG